MHAFAGFGKIILFCDARYCAPKRERWSLVKKDYIRPLMHCVMNTGKLSGKELCRIDDEELAAYLKENGFKDKSRVYRVNPGYMLRSLIGEHVLVPVGESAVSANHIVSLSETAAFIFKQYGEPKTIGDVLLAAREEYECDEQTEQHIKEITGAFLENDLIREEK